MRASVAAGEVLARDTQARDRAASGRPLLDEASFTALYQQTGGPLRAYAARVLGDVTLADDVVQETYLRILRRPAPSDDPQALRAYLFRTATHIMVDHFRKRKREALVPYATEIAADPHDASAAIDMQRVFMTLRPRDRQLMWLAHVEGAAHREIAAALGLREGSIRVLLSRARQKLAKLIGDRREK